MTRMTQVTLFIYFMIFSFAPIIAEAKTSAPVTIEYAVPKKVQTGDIVSTVIRFIAQTDLEQLKVSIAPYEGLSLLSKKEQTLFFDLAQGESREIEVEIQLTDPEIGYLSVFATTSRMHSSRTKIIAIPYGKAGALTRQKLNSKNRYLKASEDEALILMPGDPR